MGLDAHAPSSTLPLDPTLPGDLATDWPIIEFNNTVTGVHEVLFYADFAAAIMIDGTNEVNQMRFWVYAKWGVMDICVGTCSEIDNVIDCPADLSKGRPATGTDTEDPVDNFPNLGAND